MSRDPERTIRLAVAILPKHLRERYREQWTGELRDAAEVGIPRVQLAQGALKFSATVARPLPSWMRVASPRFSVALALSAALVSLSEYATLVPVTDGSTFTESSSLATTPLIAWVVLIPAVAFLMGMVSRTATKRERAIVTLLAIASYLPFLRGPVDEFDPSWTSPWLTLGALTYAAGGMLLVVAGILAWREYAHPGSGAAEPRMTRLRRSAAAGAAVMALVIACSIDEFARWASRTPPVWAQPITSANRAMYEQWVELKAQAEAMVSQLLMTGVIVGLVVALAVVAFGFSRRATLRRTIGLAAGLAAVALASYGGIVLFLQIVSLSIVVLVPVGVVMLVARIGMIVVVLFFLGRAGSPTPVAPEHLPTPITA